MSKPLAGVKVIEVGAFVFVPMAGAVLADLGADVIKVEPRTGDPMRGLLNANTAVQSATDIAPPNLLVELTNRGKRSIALDLTKEAGRDVLYRLVREADVFTTSYLEDTRVNLGVDVDTIREVNPRIIYARGSGWGAFGPMANAPAYDMAAAWASSGLAHAVSARDGEPPSMPIGIYDTQAGNTLAGAIGIALYRRTVTGEGMVVDTALINAGMFAVQSEITAAPLRLETGRTERTKPNNATVNWYRTSDGRWIFFVLTRLAPVLESFYAALDRPDLLGDERFADDAARAANAADYANVLADIVATRTLAEWEERFADFPGCWSAMRTAAELHDHPQMEPNGFIHRHRALNGFELPCVAPPMHFDGESTHPKGPAPEVGQHSELILVELGYDWDEIAVLQDAGVIGPA